MPRATTVLGSSTLLARDQNISHLNRPDPLKGFKLYEGGYDMQNKHYWAVNEILMLMFMFTADYDLSFCNFLIFFPAVCIYSQRFLKAFTGLDWRGSGCWADLPFLGFTLS